MVSVIVQRQASFTPEDLKELHRNLTDVFLLYIIYYYIVFILLDTKGESLANTESYKGGTRDRLWAPIHLILDFKI